MARYLEEKQCKYCGTTFEAYTDIHKFCSQLCRNQSLNKYAHRLSLKLTDEQREVILALEKYFIRDWEFKIRDDR
jgi:endogenous inhibitor of DNA gyrase (YacG/DUF329 family)